MNLAGVDVADIERGMVLAPNRPFAADANHRCSTGVLPGAPRAFARARECEFILARPKCWLAFECSNDRGEIAPGETGFAQLRLESPVVALHDERFIVRSYSPAETIAGGLVLDPLATKHRGKELAKTHEHLRALMDSDRPARFAGIC